MPRSPGAAAAVLAAVSAAAACATLCLAAPGGAFVGGAVRGWLRPAQLQDARGVEVARGVMKNAPPKERPDKASVFAETINLSNEELHAVISDSRKSKFMYRLEKFRKRSPSLKGKLTADYKITLAKTILRQRAIEIETKEAEEAEPAKILTYAEEIALDFDSESARKSWAAKGQIGHHNPNPVPKLASAKAHRVKVPYYEEPGFDASNVTMTPKADHLDPLPPIKRYKRHAFAEQEAKPSRPSVFAGAIGTGFLAAAVMSVARRSRRNTRF